MAVNRFDEACRFAIKLDPVGFLTWLLGVTAETLLFRDWLDTRTVVFPGQPPRTCDTVAWLGDDDPAVEWAVPVEFCLEPDPDMFGRLLIYLGHLWLEKRPTDQRGERFHVGAVVINLTGRGRAARQMVHPRLSLRTHLGVIDCNLCDAGAAATLEGIAAGQVARCVLPWIPLFSGGAELAIITRWKELAAAEPESRLRSLYAALALVFAEATDCRAVWQRELTGWNVKQPQIVLDWINEGEVMGRAASLLRVLRKRFTVVPPELEARLLALTDAARLDALLDAAVTVASLEEFGSVLDAG
jgi:hypothetical protein